MSWYKDDRYLRTENYNADMKDQHHLLSVTSLKESDYGNYTCEGTNQIGVGRQTIELKGEIDR